MKKFIVFLFLVCIFGIVYVNRNSIINFVLRNVVSKNEVVFAEPNEYYKDYDYIYVQNTTNLYPSSKHDILNIIYSTLNRGVDEVVFYCADGYNDCINDINNIAEDSLVLATINNFVHPYNSYSKIYFSINDYGKVKINVSKNYSDEDIELINNKLDEILDSLFYDGMSDYDKIKAFHDYIINNTSYDSSVSIESQIYNKTDSSIAKGLLFNGKAICSGYSDTMAIFLNKLGINNYKISSDEHIWNLVYIDGSWKHIDATWDDPITVDGRNVLIHDFFLLSTDDLFNKEKNIEKNNHQFDRSLYLEAN